MEDVEKYAENVREAGKSLREAVRHVGRCELTAKKRTAQTMAIAEAHGIKTLGKQERYADEDEKCFDARMSVYAAKGDLEAAKAELEACKMEFQAWRSKMATLRFEKNQIYNTD